MEKSGLATLRLRSLKFKQQCRCKTGDEAVKKAVVWLTSQQSNRSPSNWDSETFWFQSSINRPGTPLNDRFASDFASSYASLTLQMYGSDVLGHP